jgi:hypothetical protein
VLVRATRWPFWRDSGFTLTGGRRPWPEWGGSGLNRPGVALCGGLAAAKGTRCNQSRPAGRPARRGVRLAGVRPWRPQGSRTQRSVPCCCPFGRRSEGGVEPLDARFLPATIRERAGQGGGRQSFVDARRRSEPSGDAPEASLMILVTVGEKLSQLPYVQELDMVLP